MNIMPNKINQEQRAYYAWNVLISCAKRRSTLTYGELAERISIHHRAVRFVLDVIYDYCYSNNLPPLTILIVNKNTQFPGQGFTDYTIDTFQNDLDEVFDKNWESVENPFDFAKDGNSELALINQILQSPESSDEVYAKVKVRGITQILFRKALLKAYDSSCAICGFSFESALEAAHIIPYSQCNSAQRLDVRNGILLCSLHHKLFDHDYITITETCQIKHEVDKEDLKTYSKLDKILCIDFNDKYIRFPVNKNHHPNKSYIKARNGL
jgi:putative restriction endonuclease